MSTRYELRFSREGREVRELPPLHEDLDLRDLRLLDRYLMAAAGRAGLRQNEAHLLTVELRRVDQDGRPYGDVVLRRALPLDEDGARGWR